MKVKIKHIDGVTDVTATVYLIGKEGINCEYRFEGMTYGRTMSLPESIKLGIIKKVKANNSFRELKKGEKYPINKIEYAEDNIACTKGDMIINGFHFSNFEASL